jgi:SAM-dependent methyltransferase
VELQTKEQLEIDQWRNSPTDAPGLDSIENLVNKLTDAPVFLEAFERHGQRFKRAARILELGGGQGWASCIVKKRLAPGRHVTASDLSPFAIASVGLWERVFDVRLDGALHCRSYEIPVEPASVDLVFTFQAAHHFVAHRRTLRELFRILTPGGAALYLHEPTCSRWIHPIARHRVNHKGMPVPEDVLVHARLLEIARETGFGASTVFDLSVAKRAPLELLYYSALRTLPLLKHWLPCTRDFVFEKPGR